MWELEQDLKTITGMDAFSLQPAAGAQAELLGVMMTKAYFRREYQKQRTKIIIPDSAHGTNPATASMCRFKTITIPSDTRGNLDIDKFRQALQDDVALVMLTNPNTLGLFEENILEISDLAPKNGTLMYCDGANMNAMLGITRPADQGFDLIHLNLHKTFSTPHGGGGPGAGTLGVRTFLKDYLPLPRIVKRRIGGDFKDGSDLYNINNIGSNPSKANNLDNDKGILYPPRSGLSQQEREQHKVSYPASTSDTDEEKHLRNRQVTSKNGYEFDYMTDGRSVGRLKCFYGNFGTIVRAYSYIRAWGSDITKVSEGAILNANYLLSLLNNVYELPYKRPCAHEFVITSKKFGNKSALDIAKRLMDYGYHPPTIYFPLIVREALMIEPTETESKQTLDDFGDALLKIADELETNPEVIRGAPHTTYVARLDEVNASRNPDLRWKPSSH